KQRVWLVGFSFGADVLPTLIGGLDPANRARIAQVVLLAPGRDLLSAHRWEHFRPFSPRDSGAAAAIRVR
ncbi:MAG: hypothetical protein IT480_18035, partial [Gammaproteobacteria bacterium]|nr:hypothetical protein [Gammaproteobacteria bacterium]